MASCLRLVSSNASRSSSMFSSLRSNLGRRGLHKAKELPYPIEEGLGKFLPPAALKTMMEYQEGLLTRLNRETRSDPKLELHETVTGVVNRYASQRDRTLAFNYAVLALNNSFFLEQLAPPPPEESGAKSHQAHISDELFEKIRNQYGDLIGLKSTFSASAMGMFSNGWIWFVTDGEGNLGVVPTLGPSTILVRSRTNMHYNPGLVVGESHVGPESSHVRNIPANPNIPPGVTPSLPTSGTSGTSGSTFQRPPYDLHTRTIHSSSAQQDAYDIGTVTSLHGTERVSKADVQGSAPPSVLNVGKVLYPLFCVPVYEHAWLSAGFGIWGKEAWLAEFWSVLDWSKVSRAYRFGNSKA